MGGRRGRRRRIRLVYRNHCQRRHADLLRLVHQHLQAPHEPGHRIEGRRLLLGACDLVDGTPVFDVKPYVPAFDAFPESRAGWIDAVDAAMREPARFSVVLSALAATHANWLRETWSIDFIPRLTELLARDPSPHRTRRIKRRGPATAEIGCGAWLAEFTVAGDAVRVLALKPAYPLTFLLRDGYENIPDRDAQLAFLAQWPPPASPGDSSRPAQT